MSHEQSSRRHFLERVSGGLAIGVCLSSPEASFAVDPNAALLQRPITGGVLRSTGSVSADGKVLLESARQIPVVKHTDVIVCGGGPAGIAAAIAAARSGAQVQLIEAAGCLGGVWTAGLLTKILDAGNKSGLMAELLERFSQRGSRVARQTAGTVYDPEIAKLILEEMSVGAGVKIRLHTRVVAAVTTETNRLAAVITESKSGREAWTADCFIDCTGDGDLAAHAGCEFDVGVGANCECQPLSLIALLAGPQPDSIRPFIRETEAKAKQRLLELMESAGIVPSYRAPTLRHLHSNIYSLMTNHQYGISAFDAQAITQATLEARREVHEIVEGLRRIGGPWSQMAVVATAEQIGVREGRRIRGRYTITAKDLATGLRHPESVCRATFPIDVHALSRDGDRKIDQTFKEGGMKAYDIPYPALVAADVDALLVAGRCISGDFVAHSSYRVTGNAVPMGEAAGRAAAMAVHRGTLPHELNWEQIRASS